MEKPNRNKKEKGKLAIENKTGKPLDPDSAALEAAVQITEDGFDVEVEVHPHDSEEKLKDSSE